VIQAAPSGPVITPCGADPGPSGTSRTLPLRGSRWPRVPLPWPVYQTPPSTAGETSWGWAPAGTAYRVRVGPLASPRGERVAAPVAGEPDAVGEGESDGSSVAGGVAGAPVSPRGAGLVVGPAQPAARTLSSATVSHHARGRCIGLFTGSSSPKRGATAPITGHTARSRTRILIGRGQSGSRAKRNGRSARVVMSATEVTAARER
jgi:hypothetical protein